MPPRSNPGRWRVTRWILAVVWVAIVLVGIGFWFHHRFVAALLRQTAPTWLVAAQGDLAPELMRRVGYFANAKRSSFRFASERKATGATRLCAFGDSFTHGDEVDARSDFPTLLRRELDARAPNRFEVLNFGVSSYGFHQAFLLWDALGARYGCDEVLLGPATFFPDRDTSFNHAGLDNPYYLHARYVLDGDGVRLVEVVGDSLQARSEQYLRFVPRLEYARYDRSPPVFLRALLRTGETVPNPFYYHPGDVRDEARETYRRLLRIMAASGAKIRLGLGAAGPIAPGDLDDAAVDLFSIRMPRSFPYVAPRGHQGPIGNQLVARQFAQRLLPDDGPPPSLLRVTDLPPAGDGVAGRPRRTIARFPNAHVAIGGVPVGLFVRGERASRRAGSFDLLLRDGVATLVHVGGPGRDATTGSSSILDGCFVPSRTSWRKSPRVCLRVEHGGAMREHCTGRLRLVDQRIAVAVLEIDGVTVEDRPVGDEEQRLLLRAEPGELQEALRGASRLAITVDGETILTGTPESQGGHRLVPAGKSCLRVRATAGGLVDVAQLPDAGTVDLVLHGGGDRPLRVPVARWEKAQPIAPAGAPSA